MAFGGQEISEVQRLRGRIAELEAELETTRKQAGIQLAATKKERDELFAELSVLQFTATVPAVSMAVLPKKGTSDVE